MTDYKHGDDLNAGLVDEKHSVGDEGDKLIGDMSTVPNVETKEDVQMEEVHKKTKAQVKKEKALRKKKEKKQRIEKREKEKARKKAEKAEKAAKKRKKAKEKEKAKRGSSMIEEVDDPEAVQEAIDAQAKGKQKLKEDKTKTTFRFRIADLRLKLIGKRAGLPPIFVEAEMGGLSKDVKSQAGEEKKVKKTSKESGETKEVSLPVEKTETEILIKSTNRFYTRLMRVDGSSADDELVIKFSGTEEEGIWQGSYDSLAKETLSVRVWHTAPGWMPNRLIGLLELNMLEVARSTIDREEIIYRWTEGKSGRAEALAILNFKFELEEIFNFEIRLSKWKVELEDAEDIEPETCSCLSSQGNEPPLVIGFQMPNTQKLCGPCVGCFGSCLLWCGFVDWCGCSTLLYNCIAYKDLRCLNLPMCGYTCPWLNEDTHVYTKKKTEGTYMSVAEKELHLKSGRQILRYNGTRSQLEDEKITIFFWRGACWCDCCSVCAETCWSWSLCCWLHGPLIGQTDENLQGKLDYGYLILYDQELNRTSRGPWRCCENIWQVNNTVKATNVKGVIETLKEPRYRQLGNVGRPTGGNKWFRFEKNTLYLCVVVIRAKGLISLTEYKESLNPSVSVDWAQIRREVDRKEDNPDPFWNETVFFKVDCDNSALKKSNVALEDLKQWIGSKVVVNVWDSTGFSKAPLGYCEIPFETVFNNRKPKMIESTLGSKSGLVSRYVYSTKQILKTPKITPDNYRLDADENEEEEKSDRHIELMIYFEMGNGTRIGPPRKKLKAKGATKSKKQKPEKKLVRDPDILPKALKQARDFWLQALDSVPEFDKRIFAFCGIDEYSGNIYYLPTFVSVMVPPAEIKSSSQLLYYVSSIEMVLRKSGENFREAKKRQEELNKIAPGLRIWSDPWYFLDKRRGDHRDHAILLCNFLLGRNQDAYVCVGRAQSSRGEIEHVWVMTLEDHDAKDNNFPRTIRFWECANGKTYVRMNRRIKSQVGGGAQPEEGLKDADYIERNIDFEAETKKELGSDDDNDQDYSIKHSQAVSKISLQRQRKRFQYRLRQSVQVDYDKGIADAWADEQERAFDNLGEVATPYTGVDVVFNHKNLYANLQNPHPEKISYDFGNKFAWRSFRGRETDEQRKCQKDDGEKYFFKDGLPKVIKPFYPDKTMVGSKAQEQVVDLRERELIKIIEGSMTGYREFRSDRTKFIRKFPFQEILQGEEDTAIIYMKKRLENECKHGARDEKLVAKEVRGAQIKKSPEEVDQKTPFVGGHVSIQAIRKVWLDDILLSLPGESRYEEMLFFFKHADSSRISDSIVSKIARKFLHIPSSKHPKFAVAAKIHRLPGYISPVRVLVSVTYDHK